MPTPSAISTGNSMALSAAQGLQPNINQANQAQSFLTNPGILDPSSNPYLMAQGNAAISPIIQNLLNSILPGIRGDAGMAGQMGSSRQGIAEGLGIQGALSSAGSVLSNLFSNAYGQGLGALQGGLSLSPQTANLGLLPSQIYSQVGQQQQQQPFTGLQMFNNILGAPTVLNKGTGASRGLLDFVSGAGSNDAGTMAFGFGA